MTIDQLVFSLFLKRYLKGYLVDNVLELVEITIQEAWFVSKI